MKHAFWCLLLSLNLVSVNLSAQTARSGVIDLREWDFLHHGSIRLNGEWEFYISELIAPEEFRDTIHTPKDYITFPSTWNESVKSHRPGIGYATYHATVLLKNAPKNLAIDLPHFYSNFTLWINNKLVARNGQIGTSKDTSIPQWLPQTISYTVEDDTLEFVIQASNFHHAKGGVRESILLGTPEDLNFKRQVAVSSNIVLFGSLLITGLIFIFIFLFGRTERSVILFAALCLTWAVRSVFSNLYILTAIFPEMPWEFCVKVEYISLYMTMVWAIFFLDSLFPNDVNSVFKYLFSGCNLIFVLFTIFFRASVYTQFLPVYLSFCLILLIYIIYVLIRAVIYEREGVWLIISCMMMGVIVFSYDLIAYEGIATFNPIITNLGYFIMFMLMAICMAYQLGFLKRTSRQSSILTYDDLYGSVRKN